MIRVNKLTKRLGKSADGAFNLTVNSFGLKNNTSLLLIGENGSGKSTLIKIMCGLLLPDSGECFLDDVNMAKPPRSIYKRIGLFQGGKSTFDPRLTVKQNFEFSAYMYKCKKSYFKESLDSFVAAFPQLPTLFTKYYREMSLGQRTISGLINSLIHVPDYIFLDEPTIGVDANTKQLICQFIDTYKKNHTLTNFVVTTHDYDFAKSIRCDGIGVMENGTLIKLTADVMTEIQRLKGYEDNETD